MIKLFEFTVQIPLRHSLTVNDSYINLHQVQKTQVIEANVCLSVSQVLQ